MWNGFWKNKNIDELVNVDFFDGRQYVLKYLPASGKILEAGCGSGRYVIYLTKMGFDVTGVDISSGAISKYKQIADKFNILPDKIAYADVENIGFKDNSFSAYLSFGVIEHFIKGPEKALREAYRILKKGGIAIVTVPNKFSLPNIYFNSMLIIRRFARKILGLAIKRYAIKPEPPVFFQYWYSRKELAQFLEKFGFEIIESDTTGLLDSLWYLNPEKFKKRYVKYKYFNKVFSNSILKIFGLHSIVVARKPDMRGSYAYKGDRNIKSNYICEIPALPKISKCYLCSSEFKPFYLDFTRLICDECRKNCANAHFRNKLSLVQYKYIIY